MPIEIIIIAENGGIKEVFSNKDRNDIIINVLDYSDWMKLTPENQQKVIGDIYNRVY